MATTHMKFPFLRLHAQDLVLVGLAQWVDTIPFRYRGKVTSGEPVLSNEEV
jgi:hypothetical protein